MQYIELSRKLAELGYIIDRWTFDCGERVTVRRRGQSEAFVTASANCGDETNATDEVATYMEKLGWPNADAKL